MVFYKILNFAPFPKVDLAPPLPNVDLDNFHKSIVQKVVLDERVNVQNV